MPKTTTIGNCRLTSGSSERVQCRKSTSLEEGWVTVLKYIIKVMVYFDNFTPGPSIHLNKPEIQLIKSKITNLTKNGANKANSIQQKRHLLS